MMLQRFNHLVVQILKQLRNSKGHTDNSLRSQFCLSIMYVRISYVYVVIQMRSCKHVKNVGKKQ